MSLQLLNNYTKAYNDMIAFQEANKTVFDQNKKNLFAFMDAENALRDDIEVTQAGCENDTHVVTVTPQTQTWADIDTLDSYVAKGIITKAIRDDIVKTQKRPSRVSIKNKAV